MGGEPAILDTEISGLRLEWERLFLEFCAGQAGLQLHGSHCSLDITADTKPQNYPAMHTGHEAIKRLLKCHLLNCRFQLINPHDLEVSGGQTFAIWALELPCSLEDEPLYEIAV